MPLFAAVGGAILGSAGAASAGTFITGLVGGLTVAGVTAGIGTSIYGATRSTKIPSAEGNAATQVDASTSANVNNLGRAALISTSPQGVSGTDPTLRYKLLGNPAGLGGS